MRSRVCLSALLIAFLELPSFAQKPESCQTLHGRAHLYCGDGQLRIWHIGTHHEYTPDPSSHQAVIRWLEAGVSQTGPSACPAGSVYLFADFKICPTEPFEKGAVQEAKVLSAVRRHYVRNN